MFIYRVTNIDKKWEVRKELRTNDTKAVSEATASVHFNFNLTFMNMKVHQGESLVIKKKQDDN